MNYIAILLGLLFLSTPAFAQSPWYFGNGEAVNITNGTAFKNGVKNIAGSLDPSSTAVNAPSGSMYFSTSGTIYVKQDAGLSTNWLPLGIATTGALSTINGQSGPNVNIATGSSGSDFNIAAGSNTITLNLPSASASNRGLLLSSDWSLFNNKEPAISAGTTGQYWRGDKSWQTLDKSAVGLSNVDNTSDVNKPISNDTQDALNLKADVTDVDAVEADIVNIQGDIADLQTNKANQTDLDAAESDIADLQTNKVDGPASSIDGEIALFDSTSGKVIKRATGTGFVKSTSGVYSTSSTVNVSSEASGVLPMANGGTNKALTASNGAIAYTDTDSVELLAPGTSGQVLQSNGSAAPSFVNKSISGKSQNQSPVTVEEIQFPNSTLTQTDTNKYLIDNCGSPNNLLVNCGFEHSTAGSGWSSSVTGTATATYGSGSNSTNELGAKKGTLSCAGGASGGTCTFYQDVNTSSTIQGLVYAYLTPSNPSATELYSRVNGSNNKSVTTQDTSKFLYKIPEILGSSSTGIAVKITVPASTTYTSDIDHSLVAAVDLKQDISVVGPWTTFTPTGSWVTNTTYTGKYRQNGQNLEVQYKVTLSGAPTATSLELNLPSGFTIDTSKILDTTAYGSKLGAGAVYDASPTQIYPVEAMYFNSTAIALQIQTTMSGTNPVRVNGGNSVTNTIPITFASSDFSTVTISVPVTQFSGSTSVYSSTCGSNCVDTFSAQVSSTGVVSGENIDWLNGNCTYSSGLATCSYKTGVFTVVPNCVAIAGANRWLKGNSDINNFYSTAYSDPSTVSANVAFTVICQKQGADFVATRIIQGTFNEVNTTAGVTRPVNFRFNLAGSSTQTSICTTGACTLNMNKGGIAQSASFSATGIYSVVLSGLANSDYACSFTTRNWTSGGTPSLCWYENKTSTGFDLRCKAGGTDMNAAVDVKCEGQAP